MKYRHIYHSSAHHRGQQAMPNYKREYTCNVCQKVHVQWGPGRNRKTCTETTCQTVARALRGPLAALLLLALVTGCGPATAEPTNWEKCCIEHTVCIDDGMGGPNCDDPVQWCLQRSMPPLCYKSPLR